MRKIWSPNKSILIFLVVISSFSVRCSMANEAGVQKFHLSPARDLDSAAKLSQFAWDESRRALAQDAFAPGSALKAPLVLEDFCQPAGNRQGRANSGYNDPA